MNDLTLYQISDEMRILINQLNSEDAFDEIGTLKPELQTALQITHNELQKKAISYGYVIKHYADQETLVKAEIDRLKKLQEYIRRRNDAITDRIKNAMLEFGIEKIEGETLNLKITKSKAVNVYDQSQLEERFLRAKTVIEPDKIAIKDAILKDGEVIKGAEIIENRSLKIS